MVGVTQSMYLDAQPARRRACRRARQRRRVDISAMRIDNFGRVDRTTIEAAASRCTNLRL
jgi:hypothetical protein